MSRATNAVAPQAAQEEGPQAGEGLLRAQALELPVRQRAGDALGPLRLPRPAHAQARDAPPVDHPDQRRRPPRGHELLASSSTASTRPGSRSTARCSPTSPSATPRRSADLPSKPGRPWRPEPTRPPTETSPGVRRGRPFLFAETEQMITSKDNEKLKLVRKLRGAQAPRARGPVRRRGRGPGRGRRARPACEPELRRCAAGEDVEPELLDAVSALGSGTRVIGVYRAGAGPRPTAASASTCTASATPATSARSIRTAARARRRPGRARAGLRRPVRRRRRCGRAWARSSRSRSLRGGVEATAAPRGRRWSPTAASAPDGEPGRRRSASAPSARACPARSLEACERLLDDPAARAAAESLNVAAAAAIALGRISSAAAEGELMLERIESCATRPRRRSPRRADAAALESCGCATSAARRS